MDKELNPMPGSHQSNANRKHPNSGCSADYELQGGEDVNNDTVVRRPGSIKLFEDEDDQYHTRTHRTGSEGPSDRKRRAG